LLQEREQLAAPVRAAIASLRAGASEPTSTVKASSLHIYEGVELVALQCAGRGIVYTIRFRARPPSGTHGAPSGTPTSGAGASPSGIDWARSTRLLSGSLLALSCDGFGSVTWATVARRDVSALADPRGPTLGIALPELLHSKFQLMMARGVRVAMVECVGVNFDVRITQFLYVTICVCVCI